MVEWVLALNPSSFTDIEQHGKVVEGRAWKPEYAQIRPGDKIIFQKTASPTNGPIQFFPDLEYPVADIKLYKGSTAREAVRAMLETEGLGRVEPSYSTIDAAIGEFLNIPGYEKRIQENGILAITLGRRL